MSDQPTQQQRADAIALEDRLIGFMKENNLTKVQLLEVMQKIANDRISPTGSDESTK